MGLRRAAEVFRAYFTERKEEFRRRAKASPPRRPPRMSDLANVEELLRARLYEGGAVRDEWPAPGQPVTGLPRARPPGRCWRAAPATPSA